MMYNNLSEGHAQYQESLMLNTPPQTPVGRFHRSTKHIPNMPPTFSSFSRQDDLVIYEMDKERRIRHEEARRQQWLNAIAMSENTSNPRKRPGSNDCCNNRMNTEAVISSSFKETVHVTNNRMDDKRQRLDNPSFACGSTLSTPKCLPVFETPSKCRNVLESQQSVALPFLYFEEECLNDSKSIFDDRALVSMMKMPSMVVR